MSRKIILIKQELLLLVYELNRSGLLAEDRKSGSAGMPRPISYAVFCLKKKTNCQSLAAAVGAGARTWHAYLSTHTGAPAVNARDRIGHGPWYNAKGTLIARDLDELHGTNMLTKQTALTEKGAVVNGRGDTPSMHDILTGSQP